MDDRVTCFQLCGDRNNPSVSVSNTAYCIPANPMSDRGQAVCFSIGSMNSKGMLSDSPEAGYHETSVARTLDATGSNPAGYQGGDVVIYDARGNGDGGVVSTITGDHQNRVTDYTSVVVMALGATDSKASITDGKISPRILARAGTGGGNEPIILEVKDEMVMCRKRSASPDVNDGGN